MKDLMSLNEYRQKTIEQKMYGTIGDSKNGVFEIQCKKTGKKLFIVASAGGGWDHVSISLKNRIPLWVEMCFVKDLFFEPYETVIQFHPNIEEYVNRCKNCLHLWKNQNHVHELPPEWMVG